MASLRNDRRAPSRLGAGRDQLQHLQLAGAQPLNPSAAGARTCSISRLATAARAPPP